MIFALLTLFSLTTSLNLDTEVQNFRRLLADETCCVDILFLLDASESVGKADWKLVIDFLGKLTDPAKDPNAPLHNDRIRVGAIQYANAFTGHSGAGDTYLKYHLQKTPLPDLASWANYYVGGMTSMRDGAKLALDEFNNAKKPWELNSNTKCLPENFKQWMVWIGDGGPNLPFYKVIPNHPTGAYEMDSNGKPVINDKTAATHQSICYPRTGEQESYAKKIIKSGIQQYFIGAGNRWLTHKPYLGCLWGYDYENNAGHAKWYENFDKVKDLANFSELDAKKHWTVDPCNHCNPVDLTIIIDESGSMCDKNVQAAEVAGICPVRPPFDQQIDFVKSLISHFKPTWGEHRFALYSFASKSRNHFHMKNTGGAKTILKRADGSNTYASASPHDEAWVQNKLEWVKGDFQEGFTATAMAWKDALGEVEYTDPRLDGKKARQIILFFSDGGPNTPYYAVGSQSERYKDCPGGDKSKNGWCIYQKTQWDGAATRVSPSYHQAVCVDEGDPKPQWVRYFFNDRKWGINKEGLTYPGALRKFDVTPLVILVGDVANKHVQDMTCISEAQGSGVGGLIVADSFGTLLANPKFRAAITSNICGVASLNDALSRYETWRKTFITATTTTTTTSSTTTITSLTICGSGLFILTGLAMYLRKPSNPYQPLLEFENAESV